MLTGLSVFVAISALAFVTPGIAIPTGTRAAHAAITMNLIVLMNLIH